MKDAVETITILRARKGRLAKFVRADGVIEGYDDAFLFDAAEIAVANLQRLRRILADLLARPDCCIIRASLIAGPRARGIRRLLHPKEDAAPTLRHVEHRWLALDCDGLDCPADLDRTDIAACAEHAIQRLPAAFRDANCVAVASGSHGLKPGLRLRLWFWLARPMGTVELKRWLRDAPVDRSILQPAQPIYTAAPVFAPGLADHLANRMVELPGEEFVHPPSAEELAPPTVEEAAADAAEIGAKFDRADIHRYAVGALDRAVLSILNAGIGNRHATLVYESCRLIRFVNAGCFTESELRHVLTAAAERAGKDDADEVSKAIAWGFNNPNGCPLPEALRHVA